VLSTNDINYIEVNGIAGTKTKVVLSDGSTIWLNGDSKLVYPEKFKKAKREISFEGEGVFEVAKDRRKPFIVNLGDSKVEVLGTIFNIDTKTDDIIEATLIEGSIAFYTGDKDVPSVVMKPDEQIVYEKKTNKLLLKEVKGENYMSWINNNFRFEDEPIYSIAEQLERGFGVKINIKNDRLGQMKITGTFNHEETLDEILSIIQITTSLRWKKDIDGEYYIE
jgi:ferric-dicitrate binding protein FerR (iron transport regulator)